MIIVISPAKTLDFETPAGAGQYSMPDFLDESAVLIDQLRTLPPDQLGTLMSISSKLAALNADRYRTWTRPFTPVNAKQALYAFKGDVYTGLDAETLCAEDIAFAQDHLRILSGLYGVLRPLDLMQPYRLEMGTQLKNSRGENLYEFWGDRITDAINCELKRQKTDTLINLASNEYFKSVRSEKIEGKVITPVFKDQKNGMYKIISFFAKKARGLMSRHIIQHRLSDPEAIKDFDTAGYHFEPTFSDAYEWVFLREESKT
ncbi:MAG: peroxide stress protein YaaA [Nitrosomonas sp.]|nr:peroxide stress protein YaaA [Nitrosomonas sp.]MCW5607238.1 peroxide stress protein YaaA [Nitrosomonas sp.]